MSPQNLSVASHSPRDNKIQIPCITRRPSVDLPVLYSSGFISHSSPTWFHLPWICYCLFEPSSTLDLYMYLLIFHLFWLGRFPPFFSPPLLIPPCSSVIRYWVAVIPQSGQAQFSPWPPNTPPCPLRLSSPHCWALGTLSPSAHCEFLEGAARLAQQSSPSWLTVNSH